MKKKSDLTTREFNINMDRFCNIKSENRRLHWWMMKILTEISLERPFYQGASLAFIEDDSLDV